MNNDRKTDIVVILMIIFACIATLGFCLSGIAQFMMLGGH